MKARQRGRHGPAREEGKGGVIPQEGSHRARLGVLRPAQAPRQGRSGKASAGPRALASRHVQPVLPCSPGAEPSEQQDGLAIWKDHTWPLDLCTQPRPEF